jgi:hypothetical protein
MLWSRENSLDPAGNQTPAVQPIAIPTELPLTRLQEVIDGDLCYLIILLLTAINGMR